MGGRKFNRQAGAKSTVPQDSQKGCDVAFDRLCEKAGLNLAVSDFLLNKGGRLDFCWPEHELAIMIEDSIPRSTEVRNRAAIEGWRLLYCTRAELKNGKAVEMVVNAIAEGVHED